MTHMWIVGVEDIRPRFNWQLDGRMVDGEVTGIISWYTDLRYRNNLPPHRTSRFGKDELDMFIRFRKDCESVGYVIVEGPPDEGPNEEGAAS